MTLSSEVSLLEGCFVCGSKACQFTSHRLATLESLRRLSNHRRKRKESAKPKKSTNHDVQRQSPDTDSKSMGIGASDAYSPEKRSLTVGRECRVPGCLISKCRLQTHLAYRPQQGQVDKVPKVTTDNDASLELSNLDLSNTPERVTLTTIKNPNIRLALPIDDLETPYAEELFHKFFVSVLDHLLRLEQPPPVSEEQKRAATEFKQGYLSNALKSPLICAQSIANSYLAISQRGRTHQLDRTAMLLQSKLMALLRKQLSPRTRDMDGPDIALAICTITALEITTGRTNTLIAHRDAMRQVVANMGGLHNTKHAMKLILTFDRIVSNFSEAPLCFPPVAHERLRRPIQHPCVYGSRLDTIPVAQKWDEAVLQYCLDTCRLIELLEGSNFSFNPTFSMPCTNPDLHYMYYLREGNMNDFIDLAANTTGRDDLFRCILLSTAIVMYTAMHDNYLTFLPNRWANHIRPILSTQLVLLSPLSELNERIITWMLFVLSTMESTWSGGSWALSELGHLLRAKHGVEKYPDDWREIQRDNLRSFVWSDTCLHIPLLSIFERLDGRKLDS